MIPITGKICSLQLHRFLEIMTTITGKKCSLQLLFNYIRLRTGRDFRVLDLNLGSQKGHMFTVLHINIITLGILEL